MAEKIELKARVFITFNVQAITGLHIGGSDTGIEIGNVDKTVIRDPLTDQPYIPGSSLRGKMRSLLEKYKGLRQNQSIGQGRIHSCGAEYKGKDAEERGRADYLKCPVCQVFGLPGERKFATPTRLVVRDVQLTQNSVDALLALRDVAYLPFTEVKTEVSIDRVTSAANPRQMERVPAGSIFGPAELVYSIYQGEYCDPQRDIDNLRVVIEGLKLLEDDYLGGQGARGAGQVCLDDLQIALRSGDSYLIPAKTLQYYQTDDEETALNRLIGDLDELLMKIKSQVLV